MPRKHPSGEQVPDDEDVKAVERAMVAIRRSQTRRALTRLAEGRDDADRGDAVSSPAVDVLDAIEAAEQAGTPATVSSVAATLNVDQPRASKLVAAAVEAGLVRREADQADGRRASLVRTEQGNALFEELHRFRRSIFAMAMSDWTDAERAAFARLLTRFVESLAGITGRGGSNPQG
ncbi:MarR family winged helix-turn-helix transcriptional regulator [Phytohabitans flavus]|uniref:MarR family transcriptional regulator n=1 Tax=Phytohabitans flavus TaxID=1076124 RepID=A0A6F8XSX4_9ACTN|nr:MarR family winged helix-turn-helix transcriptional regulator [Phytohabitans flavus]BCB76897.1 MarR family transcriptional regulator [Phytohabitans flavus]